MAGLETERKFVIEKPDVAGLSSLPEFSVGRITQTYLIAEKNVTHRVRRREKDGVAVFTECKKQRISPVTCIEDEREIAEEVYRELLRLSDPLSKTIEKTRITFRHGERLIEVDVYPEWQRSCIMEVELPSEDTAVELPPFIKIVREVTGDKAYSNASMARRFPKELI